MTEPTNRPVWRGPAVPHAVPQRPLVDTVSAPVPPAGGGVLRTGAMPEDAFAPTIAPPLGSDPVVVAGMPEATDAGVAAPVGESFGTPPGSYAPYGGYAGDAMELYEPSDDVPPSGLALAATSLIETRVDDEPIAPVADYQPPVVEADGVAQPIIPAVVGGFGSPVERLPVDGWLVETASADEGDGAADEIVVAAAPSVEVSPAEVSDLADDVELAALPVPVAASFVEMDDADVSLLPVPDESSHVDVAPVDFVPVDSAPVDAAPLDLPDVGALPVPGLDAVELSHYAPPIEDEAATTEVADEVPAIAVFVREDHIAPPVPADDEPGAESLPLDALHVDDEHDTSHIVFAEEHSDFDPVDYVTPLPVAHSDVPEGDDVPLALPGVAPTTPMRRSSDFATSESSDDAPEESGPALPVDDAPLHVEPAALAPVDNEPLHVEPAALAPDDDEPLHVEPAALVDEPPIPPEVLDDSLHVVPAALARDSFDALDLPAPSGPMFNDPHGEGVGVAPLAAAAASLSGVAFDDEGPAPSMPAPAVSAFSPGAVPALADGRPIHAPNEVAAAPTVFAVANDVAPPPPPPPAAGEAQTTTAVGGARDFLPPVSGFNAPGVIGAVAMEQRTDYKPGDVANGYVLNANLHWVPATPPTSVGPLPAMWMDDPIEPGQRRYWDGTQWTERVASAADQPSGMEQAALAGAGLDAAMPVSALAGVGTLPTASSDSVSAPVADGSAPATAPATGGYGPPSSVNTWQQPVYAAGPGRRRMSGGKIALIVIASIVGAVVLVGILAAIAYPVFIAQRQKASDAAVHAGIRNTARSMEHYKSAHKRYPTTVAQIQGSSMPVRLLPGTVVVVATNGTTGFCVASYNQTSKYTPKHPLLYDLKAGGLQPEGTVTCQTPWRYRFALEVK